MTHAGQHDPISGPGEVLRAQRSEEPALKMRLCVETDIRHHVDGARLYAGLAQSFGTTSAISAMPWNTKNALSGVKVRPLGLEERGETG